MDFFLMYVTGSMQMLTGFYFLTRLLQKRAGLWAYLLFAACGVAVMQLTSTGRMAQFGGYVLLLTTSGILVCHADRKAAVLYAALVVVVMQLSYGIVNSLSGMLYPLFFPFGHTIAGIAWMIVSESAALLLSVLCYHMVCRYVSRSETTKKRYLFLVLTPIFMIFFMGEYINANLYAANDGSPVYSHHVQMFVIQLLGMMSLFCIMFAWQGLLQNFRLRTELSLLEQEEYFLNRYVEEAKARYEKTNAFRHDIKNHMVVIKELLQSGKLGQALRYISDLEGMAETLAFFCATNNPVVDILAGNKLGIAKSMGINVSCSLLLPYPCPVRDIDFCIILSNALDNAIRACQNMDAGAQTYIRVAGRVQGDFILLEIENSFQGDGAFRKGTGLLNVKAVTEEYHGAMHVKTDGGIFILSVLLIIPQHTENIPRQTD